MLPKLHYQSYAEFQKELKSFRDRILISTADFSLRELLAQGQHLQTQFQSHILPQSMADLAPEQEARVRSLQTEIHKTLRLVVADLLYLKTARQPENRHQRRQALGDRIEYAISYCQHILEC